MSTRRGGRQAPERFFDKLRLTRRRAARGGVGLAAVLLLGAAGCTTPAGPRSPARQPPTKALRALEAIAGELARGLERQPVTCIAVCEALGPGEGGRERSDFGTYILTPIASLMQAQAPSLRFVKLEDCPKYSEAWMRETALSKADAVLEGRYVPGESAFELTIEVSRPLGQVLASSHRSVSATEAYRRLAARRLLPIRPHKGDQAALQACELKTELYHAPASDGAIRVSIRPVQAQVRLGGDIRFTVQSGANGYLAILYHGSSGKLDFLVPNQFVNRLTVRSGQTLVVPTPEMAAKGIALEACEPAGWERVKAIVSREPIPWPRDAAGNVPTDTAARLRAITVVLKEARFGEARCELETKP